MNIIKFSLNMSKQDKRVYINGTVTCKVSQKTVIKLFKYALTCPERTSMGQRHVRLVKKNQLAH